MASVTWRCQPVHRPQQAADPCPKGRWPGGHRGSGPRPGRGRPRPWPPRSRPRSSSGCRPTCTSCKGGAVAGVGEVEGEIAGVGEAAADQEALLPARRRIAAVRSVGPVVEPRALRTVAGAQAVPAAGRYLAGVFLDPAEAQALRAAHRQHIAQLLLLQPAAQGMVGTIDAVSGYPREGQAGRHAPARAWPSPALRPFGTVSRCRSLRDRMIGSADHGGEAHRLGDAGLAPACRVGRPNPRADRAPGRSVLGRSGWHNRGTRRSGSSRSAPPCRCTGAARPPICGPSSQIPSRRAPGHRREPPDGPRHEVLRSSRTASASHRTRLRNSCTPSGVGSPAASASCQPFFRSTGASSPRRSAANRATRLDPPEPRSQPTHQGLERLGPRLATVRCTSSFILHDDRSYHIKHGCSTSRCGQARAGRPAAGAPVRRARVSRVSRCRRR